MGVFQPDDVMKVEPTNAHLVSNGLHEMVNILYFYIICLVCFMVFNATFNNIYSYVSRRSVLLLEEPEYLLESIK
jgi:hypothetical protein